MKYLKKNKNGVIVFTLHRFVFTLLHVLQFGATTQSP